MGYRDEVLADSPSIYFRFEDSLSNEGSLSAPFASNAVTYASGTRGKTGVFNGTSSYAEVQTTSPIYGTEWAIEAYFKSASSKDYNTIVRRSGSQHVLLRVRGSNITNGNKLECYVAGNGGAVTSFTSNVNVNDNQWHHAVLTQRAGTIYMYVDGVQVGSGAGVGTISNLTSPQEIGREASGSEFFNGSLDEVAIYNHALTVARVTAHFNASDAPPVPQELSLSAGVAGLLSLVGLNGPTLAVGAPVAAPKTLLAGLAGSLALMGVPAVTLVLSDPIPVDPETPQVDWTFEVLMAEKSLDASNPTASLEVSNPRKVMRPELKTLVRA